MKICSACSRTYEDETLTYCLADGSLLSAPHDPEATLIVPDSPTPVVAGPRIYRSFAARHAISKYLPLLLSFLILVSVATLFPPFHWEPDRAITNEFGGPQLPEKYAFIFDNSTKNIAINWLDDDTVSVTRSVIVSELILEYIIALVIALLVQVLVLKTKSLRKRRASALS